MTEELLKKAKEAQSPAELLTLMQENGMEDFSKEEAEGLYAELHMTGELTDEEMENVSAGVRVSGTKYKGVFSSTKCFTGQWECGFASASPFSYDDTYGGQIVGTKYSNPLKSDHKSLRTTWSNFSDENKCGTCIHLGFKAGTGYCEVAIK